VFGELPAPKNQMIQWLEDNEKNYKVTYIKYTTGKKFQNQPTHF